MTGEQIEDRARAARRWLDSEKGRIEKSYLIIKYGASDGMLIMHAIRRTSMPGKFAIFEDMVAIVDAVHRQRMAEAVDRRTPCAG